MWPYVSYRSGESNFYFNHKVNQKVYISKEDYRLHEIDCQLPSVWQLISFRLRTYRNPFQNSVKIRSKFLKASPFISNEVLKLQKQVRFPWEAKLKVILSPYIINIKVLSWRPQSMLPMVSHDPQDSQQALASIIGNSLSKGSFRPIG